MVIKKTTKKVAPKKAAAKKIRITSVKQIAKEIKAFSVEWSKIPTGTKLEGTIEDKSFKGRFFKSKEGYGYICQDTVAGSDSPNMLGYSKSWFVDKDNVKEIVIKDIALDLKFKVPEVFIVNGETVEFKKGSIKIGCTTVSNTLVKRIAANLIR